MVHRVRDAGVLRAAVRCDAGKRCVERARNVWSRFKLAAAAGNFSLAQRINGKLPAQHQIAPKDLERANRDPERILSKNEFKGATVAGRELALYALQRAVARSPRGSLEAVADAWRRARRQLPPGIAHSGNGTIAYAVARRLGPDALAWYREAGNASLSDIQLAWKVRAALREQAGTMSWARSRR